jgi:hypothetical protein
MTLDFQFRGTNAVPGTINCREEVVRCASGKGWRGVGFEMGNLKEKKTLPFWQGVFSK